MYRVLSSLFYHQRPRVIADWFVILLLTLSLLASCSLYKLKPFVPVKTVAITSRHGLICIVEEGGLLHKPFVYSRKKNFLNWVVRAADLFLSFCLIQSEIAQLTGTAASDRPVQLPNTHSCKYKAYDPQNTERLGILSKEKKVKEYYICLKKHIVITLVHLIH